MGAGDDEPSTWGAQLDRAERTLAAGGIVEARGEALWLLGLLLGMPRPALLAYLGAPPHVEEIAMYAGWIGRRALGEAVQHITGQVEFMGLDLRIGPACPVVAPHSQRLVELALRACRHQPHSELVAAEVGTGCGAIALGLATLEPRFTRVYALETVPAALAVARANGARYLMNLVIDWRDAEHLESVPEPLDLIVWGQVAGTDLEPAGNVWGAAEHTAYTADMLHKAREKLRPGGALVCAVPRAQQATLARMLEAPFAGAQMGFEPAGEDVAIAIVLVPRGHAKP